MPIVTSAWTQIATLPANTTSTSVNALTAGQQYQFTVRAYNGGGNSEAATKAVTMVLGPPAAPSNLNLAAVSGSQVDVSWTDNATYESSYKVWRRVFSGGSWNGWVLLAELPADSTSYSAKNLTSGALYQFTVRAYNAAGLSDYVTGTVVTP